MGTLTIRRIDDDVLRKFKEIAKRNNRSAEAEARSLLEEITAEYAIRYEMEHHNFFDRLREFMEEEGVQGFDDDEYATSDRHNEPERPPITLE
ncbi:DNA-binding protein [Bifidobacterium amazonense]|uniref:DNA-binding protein n=1 Tax=Bifidobacterium amazonense TaxID=2809027 RepID=A0ABS9VUC9_9BIFI|nr:DNA-binding protein [Bifidobacterium amazonense]MCH9275420.1 DNA-binding protein [Bifidobacterium amazonense]